MTFLIIMAAGLLGLILMALPGFNQHGHAGGPGHIAPPAHGVSHLGAGHAAPSASVPHAGGHAPAVRAGSPPHVGSARGASAPPASGEADSGFQAGRLIPSPRAIFSVLTLFGAFGYAFLHFMPQAAFLAGVLALFPAVGIEYFGVRPLWNMMFQFQGKPTTPIEQLVMCDARAVTPFRNGRGVVSLEHDGRLMQLSARLADSHAAMPVKVGDTLCVEEVDAATQRVIVSVK